jgi:putative peptidoglycan lipid II flippase
MIRSPAAEGSGTGARVARSALVVMAGLGASIVVGLVRQRVIALRFGTSSELDAFTAANSIPELLFTMLAGGALAFAFIPVYTRLISGEREDEPTLLLSRVINSVLLLTALAALLLAISAPTLISARWGIAPNFPAPVQALTIKLMRILLLSTLIFAASSILTGALHAHQHFLLPALAPTMYSFGIITGAWLLAPRLGILGLAWGAVLGAGLHLLIQLPGAWIYRLRWRPTMGWGDPQLRRVAWLMAPRVADLLMARASIDWINANLGSGLGEGRLSSLRYAFQLMNTPWTLIGTAIGIAVFPTLAALAAREDASAQRRAFSGALRAILTLAFPAAIALLLFGRPLIVLLFQGGEFTSQSTNLVFYALQFYTVALVSQSVLEVVVRAFAARQDTLTPLIVSLFTTALNVGLAVLLSRPRSAGGLEHGGLALANGVAVAVEASIGIAILHLRWRAVDGRRIATDAAKAALAAALMGAGVLLFQRLFAPAEITFLLGGGILGLALYFGLALALGIEEIRTLPASVIAGMLARRSARA